MFNPGKQLPQRTGGHAGIALLNKEGLLFQRKRGIWVLSLGPLELRPRFGDTLLVTIASVGSFCSSESLPCNCFCHGIPVSLLFVLGGVTAALKRATSRPFSLLEDTGARQSARISSMTLIPAT